MRLVFIALYYLIFSISVLAQKPITVEDIWRDGAFTPKGVPGFNFQRDGVHCTRLREQRIEQYDLRNGESTGILFDGASAKVENWKGAFDGYSFSPDEKKLLIATGTQSIYRRSSQAQYFVFDRDSKSLTRLYDGAPQRSPVFSPDGSKVAFIVDNNLWYKDLNTGKTTAVTTDGARNAVINGASDWVYEEEFELVRAFEWSPDGQTLAFLRFDEREVPTFSMELYRGGMYPAIDSFKYPKVGEKNAIVTAHLYQLNGAKQLDIKTNSKSDDYFPRLQWTPGGALCLIKLNRHQSLLELLMADPVTGDCRLLLEEKSPSYVELRDPVFLSDGSGFLWQSERSGFNHLYRFNMQGKLVNALTKGDWEVTEWYGLDEKNGLAYFQAAAVSPMQREIYAIKLNGKGRKKLSGAPGWHTAEFSPNYAYFSGTFSTINTPPQYAVYDQKGKIVRPLEQNDALRQRLTTFGVQPAEFFDCKTSAGVKLNGWMIKPKNATGKTPLLMFVYGGPGSQQVTEQWKSGNYGWFQMLAQQGYTVACVDNRGTGGRGEQFKKMTYLQLGKYETEDQIEAAKYLGKLPGIDPERIGIFGWSYGGYMSSLCLLKGADVFKAAIAVAPVTNWKWYDSIYTERYMQTEAENPAGYADNSPVNFADQLKGSYLLVHGLADDNVHFQHSAEMANRLIGANKQFETMFYPNRNHGISGGMARLHLYTLMTNFLDKNLKNMPARP